jgi:hypothetical protein
MVGTGERPVHGRPSNLRKEGISIEENQGLPTESEPLST